MSPQAFPEDEPPEHLRFAAYLSELEQVSDAEEFDLVDKVLTDPYQVMAQSAVVRHLDRRAGDLCSSPDYTSWATRMAKATAHRPFLTRRLEEWTLFRAVSLEQPWDLDALTEASDWLQRKIAESADATAALLLLAEQGRTKGIRHTARTNLVQQRKR